ncbi:MAG: SAM-dependent methyltransferase [Ignavibacteriae bacterium]|nr:SAM-dependent methyltransferase [Ignavibacteriota bacterium]
MKQTTTHQVLPNSWPEREKLREKGQFWTPEWVAKAMVAFVAKDASVVFDPAVGKGAFYSALVSLKPQLKHSVRFYGTDIDEKVLDEASKESLFDPQDSIIELKDFIQSPPKNKFEAIVANPPYIRHHRLSAKLKGLLYGLSLRIIGEKIDGRAGIHIYFLIQALNLLKPDGKLAFILPSDTFEGVFASKLWNWIAKRFRIDCVITFSPNATPFPNVDTNAVVVLIRNNEPGENFFWVRANQQNSNELFNFVISSFDDQTFSSLDITRRSIQEALTTGFSRFPGKVGQNRYRLSHLAKVMRGIATGANDFFFLSEKKAKELKIPEKYLKPAVGRTRDVSGSHFTTQDWESLNNEGRPTLLLSLDNTPIEKLPKSIQEYLQYGESLGLHKMSLIATRNHGIRWSVVKYQNFCLLI